MNLQAVFGGYSRCVPKVSCVFIVCLSCVSCVLISQHIHTRNTQETHKIPLEHISNHILWVGSTILIFLYDSGIVEIRIEEPCIIDRSQ